MHRVKFNDYAELLSDDLNNNNAYLYNGLITTIADFIAANDCVSGLEVTAQAVPDMTVYVKAGRIYQDGYQGFLEADLTTPLTIAPASANQPRIDLICAKYEEVEDEPEIRNVMTDVVSRNITQVEVKTRIASSIAFQVVGGTAAAEPTVPTTPEGWVALAKVTIPANTSVIQQSNIVDMRPKIINIYQHDHSGGANGAKLDYNNLENLPDLSVFKGATTSNNGTKGMVPAPAKGNNNRYLKSDGTWGEIDTMQGATSGAAGKSGLVPVPTAGANNRYLSADGTWKTISGMKGATSSAAGTAGLVPAPAQNQQKNFLTGAGTWQAIATTTQAQAGTDDSAPMTALKVKQAIAKFVNTILTGTILPFAGNSIPSGFLACNGAAVSRTTYSNLFSAIGTTYGSGNGSTTFNLPLAEDNRFLEFASTAGTKKNAGLPNIAGSFKTGQDGTGADTGAFESLTGYQTNWGGHNPGKNGEITYQHNFNASRSNAIYGASTTVQPKSLTVRAIIKY